MTTHFRSKSREDRVPVVDTRPVKTYAEPGVPSEFVLPPSTFFTRIKDNMGLAQITAVNLTVFFLLWEYVAWLDVFPSIFFPGPSEIAVEYKEMIADGTLIHNAKYSLMNLTIGFVLAAGIGVTLGMAAGTMRWFNTILSPYYWSLNAMPNLAILPLIVLWFGFVNRIGLNSAGSEPCGR